MVLCCGHNFENLRGFTLDTLELPHGFGHAPLLTPRRLLPTITYRHELRYIEGPRRGCRDGQLPQQHPGPPPAARQGGVAGGVPGGVPLAARRLRLRGRPLAALPQAGRVRPLPLRARRARGAADNDHQRSRFKFGKSPACGRCRKPLIHSSGCITGQKLAFATDVPQFQITGHPTSPLHI